MSLSPIGGAGGYYSIASPTSQYEQEKLEEARKRMGMETPADKQKEMIDPLKKDEQDARHGGECETCKNRKYTDGSDEMVSFKSPTHLSPTQAASSVRAHEQEHVSNAYSKASQNNAKVTQCSVAIHTAVCPECGRTYVSGGTTTTQIKYYNESNPYQKDKALQDSTVYAGMNVDAGC